MNTQNNVRPLPCKNVSESTVKQWFQKINEEVDEFKAAVLIRYRLDDVVASTDFKSADKKEMIEEACDVIVVLTSFLRVLGVDEELQDNIQQHVNNHNRERGRL